jgi:hypothetical protein
MKLFLLACNRTHFVFIGVPYIGAKNNERKMNLGEKVVLELTEPLKNSGTNITRDNYFTSHDLGEKLLDNGMTLLGTMRKHRREIPPLLQANPNREKGSSIFVFTRLQTMVSYVPKKNKTVILYSTMHHDGRVDRETGKPDIILDYNATKGSVDTVDQLCHTYSEQRRTKRWPMAYFYNILNITGINSMVVFLLKYPQWEEKNSTQKIIPSQSWVAIT